MLIFNTLHDTFLPENLENSWGGGKFVGLNIKKKRYEQILFIDGDIACHCNNQPCKGVKREEIK